MDDIFKVEYDDSIGDILISQLKEKKALEKLRNPLKFDDFIGQEEVKQRMRVYVKSAKIQGVSLDHTLFWGHSGFDKRTMAAIIANELGVNMAIVCASDIKKPGDLAAVLTNLNEREVVFIEDIHWINKETEKVICSVLENFKLPLFIRDGPSARELSFDLPKFTLIASTPQKKLLSHSLLERFGIIEEFVSFSTEELQQIILLNAKILGIQIEPRGAFKIAEFSNGTPKIALRLLKRIRDFGTVKNELTINEQLVTSCIKVLDIDDISSTSSSTENSRFIPEKVRNRVWRRDGGKCVQCGSNKNLEFDHVIPLSKGGSNTTRNLQLLCEKCNREKYNKI
jgi:Holliday junction DNA helicase RuvB